MRFTLTLSTTISTIGSILTLFACDRRIQHRLATAEPRAAPAQPRSGLTQTERLVEGVCGLLEPVLVYQTGYPNFAGRDTRDVDLLLGDRPEHLPRHPPGAFH